MDVAGNLGGLPTLFSHMDDVAFFLKNERFQIIFANRAFYGRLGFSSESEIVGKEDFGLFPEPLAKKFRTDDAYVLKTGNSKPRMIELFLNQQGLPDWYATSKLAVLGPLGKPVGVMGTVQRYDHADSVPFAHKSVSLAITAMRSDPGGVASLQRFADDTAISYRHFNRLFKEATGLTPKQYLGRSRVQRACEKLMRNETSIADIAVNLGYCDQSAFTSQFRKRMGFTPLQYRKRFSAELS